MYFSVGLKWHITLKTYVNILPLTKLLLQPTNQVDLKLFYYKINKYAYWKLDQLLNFIHILL